MSKPLVLGALLVAGLAPRAVAEELPPPGPLTVAVLDFAASREEAKDLAGTLPDLVEGVMGTSDGIRLVTRRDLGKLQQEQSLDLAGLVAYGKGAQVGRLIGAQVLVVGRLARIDDELVLTARAIGSETGAFLPAVVRAPSGNRRKLADDLGRKLVALLGERGGELIAKASPLEAATEKTVADVAALHVALPVVAVSVAERHLRVEKAPDPAAETALLVQLPRLGFPLAPIPGAAASGWLEAAAAGTATLPSPASVQADVVIVGAGFSEYAGRVGELVSCRARLEVKALDMKTGRVLGVFAASGAAADLAEHFAGKKALEELGRRAALELGLAIAKARADEE